MYSFAHVCSGIVEDATCFAQLLRLWDGLCGWEEGSSTPVLHIGWAKPFVSVLNKFPASTRKAVHIVSLGDPADSSRNNNNGRFFIHSIIWRKIDISSRNFSFNCIVCILTNDIFVCCNFCAFRDQIGKWPAALTIVWRWRQKWNPDTKGQSKSKESKSSPTSTWSKRWRVDERTAGAWTSWQRCKGNNFC